MLKHRFLWQLYAAFLVIVIISVDGVGWYASKSFYNFYLNEISESLKSRAYLIEGQLKSYLRNQNYKETDNFCKQLAEKSSTRITVILRDGVVIADSDEIPSQMENHAKRPEFQQVVDDKKDIGKSIRYSSTLGKKMMYLAIPIKQDDEILAVVRTAVPVTAINQTLKSIYNKLLIIGIITAICMALLSLYISRKISLPIEQMTEVAKNVAAGRLDMRLPIPDTAEFADLAKASNEMLRQLNSKIDVISAERSQIQAILSSMIEGVLAVDSLGHIVSINKTAANLLKINSSNCQNRSIEEVIRNPQLQQYIRNTIDNKQPTETESLVLNEEGCFLQLYGSSLTDNKGNKNGAVLVLHDITRTRRLEEMRRDFVANVSHELKTPITSIKGFVETLQDGAIDNPLEAKRFLEIIARHAERLNAIVDDLLSLSVLEEDLDKRRLSFENANLKPLLNSTAELAKMKAEQKNITIEVTCEENIYAQINPALIEQAVLNLIDNAIKYSPNDSKILVNAQVDGKEVKINVSDQGSGIGTEHLEHIFERFYVVDKSRSRKLGGTGLGLSIVKHIAQVHGGYITVESKINQGSTFIIHLPAGNSIR
ncbi:MAG: PAS domain-containing protein [Sedimentisphaerales bacterium]|nr:PAS domain-containing protein [Sedimentisphaerales bacterium]